METGGLSALGTSDVKGAHNFLKLCKIYISEVTIKMNKKEFAALMSTLIFSGKSY